MKVVLIGATGHVGTYLVPMLDAAGHEVVAVSRGKRTPYAQHSAFRRATSITLERPGRSVSDGDAADAERAFAAAIADLHGEVVIDMISFRLESTVALAEAIRGSATHLLVCGTIWIHGPSSAVPLRESDDRNPFGEYGINKLAITDYLEREARIGRVPATIIHPGHIVGPGWAPLNPEGHFNIDVFRRIESGEAVRLPNFGMETVHHVHAADVAGLFHAAIERWSGSVGESFHAVSPAALSLRGYAEAMYRWYGAEPAIQYLPWDEWTKTVTEQEAKATHDHIAHSPNCSMEKAKSLLGFAPRYSSLDSVQEAVTFLRARGYRL